MKKFDKITREGKSVVHSKGDKIVALEKLDGANASISINSDLEVKCFSRNNELDEQNTLRGWYGFAMESLAPKLTEFYKSSAIDEEVIIYGEWLVQHKVVYQEEAMKKFYPFAIFHYGEYLDFENVEGIAEVLDLDTPKVFYRGEFNGLSELLDFVGQSNITLEENDGEGIVIFNETLASENPEGCRTKIVSDRFAEKAMVKSHKVKDMTVSEAWVSQFATEARIEKVFMKMIDENELPEIKFTNFGKIASPLSLNVYNDIMEEELDSIPELYNEKFAKRVVNKRVPLVVRKYIENNA